MRPVMGGKYVGEQVHQPDHTGYLLYHDRQGGTATVVRPHLPAPGQPDVRLLHLKTFSNRDAPTETRVPWQRCNTPLRAHLKAEFDVESPPPYDAKDMDDPRNTKILASATEFVNVLGRFRIAQGEAGFTRQQASLLHGYVREIIAQTNISQTQILIATRYLERLPPEKLQALKLNDFDRFAETDSSALELKTLIAGTLMLARMYFSDDGGGPKDHWWQSVAGLPDKNAMLEIFSALGYGASVGEVGNPARSSSPDADGKVADGKVADGKVADGGRRFSPKGTVTLIVETSEAELEKSKAESRARWNAALSLSGPPATPLVKPSRGTPPIVQQLKAQETKFERILFDIRVMPTQEFRRAFAGLVSSVDDVEPRHRLPLLQCILQRCVRVRHYPEKFIGAAMDELRRLLADHPDIKQKNQINALAMMMEINLPRDKSSRIFANRKALVRNLVDHPDSPRGIIYELDRQRAVRQSMLDYIDDAESPDEMDSGDLVIDLVEFGRILGLNRALLDEFSAAFVKGRSEETRAAAIDDLTNKLVEAAEKNIERRALTKVLDDINERAGELRLSLSAFDDFL